MYDTLFFFVSGVLGFQPLGPLASSVCILVSH